MYMTKKKDITDRVRGAEMEGSQGTDCGNDGEENKTATAFSKTKLKRIMRRALQRYPQAEIDEDARTAVDRCTLEFANLVTTVAAEQSRKESRSIVNGNDLISAMDILGFHQYVGPLNEYLRRYRESKAMPPLSLGQPQRNVVAPATPTTVVATGEVQEPTPPQPFGFVLGQQPSCDVTELGLRTDVYAVWSRDAKASTSRH